MRINVIFNESVPGHLSPRHGNAVDIASLPPPSIILDPPTTTDIHATHSSPPHSSPTPLYNPTLSSTIRDRDTIINSHTHIIPDRKPIPSLNQNITTMTYTPLPLSLPLTTLLSLIYHHTPLKTQTTMTYSISLSSLLPSPLSDIELPTYPNHQTPIKKPWHDLIKTYGSLQ